MLYCVQKISIKKIILEFFYYLVFIPNNLLITYTHFN